MKKLLVVVDMQNDFINGALGSEEAVAIVPNVVEKIKNWDGDIICTQDTHGPDYMETREGKYLPVPHCIDGTVGHKIVNEVCEALFDKNTRGDSWHFVKKTTFGSIELPKIIGCIYEDVEYIELIGVCTDICVVSNAMLLKTHFPEINIAVDASCCAGVTPEKHKAALGVMKSCQIDVIKGE